MKRLACLGVIAAIAIAGVTTAGAWEAQTTHAGLAEQAALASRLHKRLVSLGFSGGLFEPLTIPPADAPALMTDLHLLSPSHGSVPDARGRQSALAWLSAGAALADVPAAHGANHFFDPTTGHGWDAPDPGLVRGAINKIGAVIAGNTLPATGMPAPDWVIAKTNPFNLDAFLAQYGKAVTAATPGERSRHMAAALIAAGAMMHTLGDLGAPSRVRGDMAAHLEPLGGGPDDLGSRFERIAALAYGRLGVPAPSRTITRAHLRDLFTSPDGGGLADLIARSYFSPNTLPAPSQISRDAKPVLARPRPALPRLNLMAASRDDGELLRDPKTRVCLARYKVEHGTLEFSLDDDCMLEQVTAILPEVAAYETAMLDFLLRGELTITVAGEITVKGSGLGAGSIDILVEDERGVRTPLLADHAAGPDGYATVATPTTGSRVVAVFHGLDAEGEPIVAVGALPIGAAAQPPPAGPTGPALGPGVSVRPEATP